MKTFLFKYVFKGKEKERIINHFSLEHAWTLLCMSHMSMALAPTSYRSYDMREISLILYISHIEIDIE